MVTMHAVVVGILLLASVGNSATAAGQVQQAEVPVYYRVTLENAMFVRDPRAGREIVLDLKRVGNDWRSVYGVSRNYNMPFHRGAVLKADMTDDAIELVVSTDVNPDKWIRGGQGRYTVRLEKDSSGTFVGTHEGQYNGTKLRGAASAQVYAPERAEDFVPLAPREHPRLLFRKHQLAALRAKAGTPFGQAAIKKLAAANRPATLALLYQITGDKHWADKALAEAELYMAGKKPRADPFVPKRPLMHRLEQLALTYDCCYDVLPDDFKVRYRAWVANLAFLVYFAPEGLGTTNWHVVSNHVADVYSGILLSALALFDEPAPEPEPPSKPFLATKLPPAADFKPAKGVPVVPLTPGKSPVKWIRTEPLYAATADDPRVKFYGLEKVHPTPGTKVNAGGFELTFQPFSEADGSTSDKGGLYTKQFLKEATAKGQLPKPFTMVGYTVIEVKAPGRYVVRNPSTRANLCQISLAGELMEHGQIVELDKGFYPMMLMVQWRIRWPEAFPSLATPTEKDETAWQQKIDGVRNTYQTRLKAFETAKAIWEKTGADPAFLWIMRVARFTSSLHCTDAVGRGGFQAEVGHYATDAMRGHAGLWSAYRNVFGYDITPGNEYPDVIPRVLVGGPQDINGKPSVSHRLYAALFPTIREAWKPDVLTAWHNYTGVTEAKDTTRVLDRDPLYAFVNYPLNDAGDGPAIEPAPIGTNLPRVWRAPAFGYYAFRSGWDTDAFIAQVFLKSRHISGWHGANAGTYRLRGLGRNWATGTSSRERNRQLENVVWMPASDLDEGARGHLTYFEAGEDTCIISGDLNEVYEREGVYTRSQYGHLRYRTPPGKKTPEPSGITGMRALAFDYSGLSGAPCLFAVVDRIDGGEGEKRVWLFHPPMPQPVDEKGKRVKLGEDDPSPLSQCTRSIERGFLVTPQAGGPTLRGLFAHPDAVAVGTDPMTWSFTKNWGQRRGSTVKVTINALAVPGEDHFFFVGTVADGEHPRATFTGKGLDSVITVGKRTVAFDGEKIVLGRK